MKLFFVLCGVGLALWAGCTQHPGSNADSNTTDSAEQHLPDNAPSNGQNNPQRICSEIPLGLYTDPRTGEYLLINGNLPYVSYCSAQMPEWQVLQIDCAQINNPDSILVQFASGSKHYLRFTATGDTLFCANPNRITQLFYRRNTDNWAQLISLFDSHWSHIDSTARRRIEFKVIAQTQGRAIRQGHRLILRGPGGNQVALQDTSPGQSHFDNYREYFLEYYDSVYHYSRIQCLGYEYGADMFYFHNSGRLNRSAYSDMRLSPDGKTYASVGWLPMMCNVASLSLYLVGSDTLTPVFEHTQYEQLTSDCNRNTTYRGLYYHAAHWMGNDTLLLLASPQTDDNQFRFPTLLVKQGGRWSFRPCSYLRTGY